MRLSQRYESGEGTRPEVRKWSQNVPVVRKWSRYLFGGPVLVGGPSWRSKTSRGTLQAV